MQFPLQDKLDVPCQFMELVPGRLHPDGRRYLPLILLRPSAKEAPAGLVLGIVDRHHRVREAEVGRQGRARLVCALSQVRLQDGRRRGIEPERESGQASLAPQIFGEVRQVATWEQGGDALPYESLYIELLLDVGIGTIGLRTSLTATNLAATIGKRRLEPGDFVELTRSRIDILAFEPQ
jgi:hypothetical protein